MSDDNYLDQFIDQDDLPEDDAKAYPPWVSPKNNSQKAYDAIGLLRKQKKRFIRSHSLKSQYKKKSDYLITKSEIARMADTNAQPLFGSVSYSNSLTVYFNEVNQKLEEAKNNRLSKVHNGLNTRRKEELVKELQDKKKEVESFSQLNVDEIVTRSIARLPLDVKRKLKLDV